MSNVTVPAFGFGMRPRGPRMRPSPPTVAGEPASAIGRPSALANGARTRATRAAVKNRARMPLLRRPRAKGSGDLKAAGAEDAPDEPDAEKARQGQPNDREDP